MQGVRLPDDQAPKRAGEYSWMSYDRERRFWPSTFLGEREWQFCGPDGRCGAIRATKEKPQAHTVDLKLRKKMGRLYVEKPTTFGDELFAHRDRKATMRGRHGKLRPATVRFNEQCVAPWAPLFDIPVPNLRRALVEDHVTARAKVAPVAARNELQFAKASLRAAASRGQQVDPGIFAIAAIHHEPAEGRALELEELYEISSWMPERIRRIVVLCGVLGLRWSEATGLTDSMLDLKAAGLTIPRDLNKSRRQKTIPLAEFEVQLLREQLLARVAGTRLVFPTAAGARFSESGFRKVWRRATRKAGHAGFKFHWLRHTAISFMAQAGMKAE
jgi:integrase